VEEPQRGAKSLAQGAAVLGKPWEDGLFLSKPRKGRLRGPHVPAASGPPPSRQLSWRTKTPIRARTCLPATGRKHEEAREYGMHIHSSKNTKGVTAMKDATAKPVVWARPCLTVPPQSHGRAGKQRPLSRGTLKSSRRSRCPLWPSFLFAMAILIAGCGGNSGGHASAGVRQASAPFAGATSRPSAPDNVVEVPATWGNGLARFGVRDPDEPGGILYGFMDESGKVVIKPQYPEARDFHDGLAAVRLVKDGPWGYIDTLDRLFIRDQFSDAEDFSEEKAAVSKDGKLYGYVDTTGKMAIEPRFTNAASFSDGLARVGEANSQNVIYINHYGKEVLRLKGQTGDAHQAFLVPPGRDFHQGLAAASSGDHWGYIDKQGTWKIPPQYEYALDFDNGYAVIVTEFLDGDCPPTREGLIDRKGHWVIPPSKRLFDVGGPNENLIPVFQWNDDWSQQTFGFMNMKNQVVVELKYAAAEPFQEGLVAVADKTSWGYIDHKGTLVIPLQFATAGQFHYGRATVTTHDGQWGWIDTRGKWAWGPFPLGK